MTTQAGNRLNALRRRLPNNVRGLRGLIPIALVLMLILATAALLGTIALQHANSAAISAPSWLVARADYHAETVVNGEDLELDLAISQVGNDCQAALNGGFCLRYAVVQDEQALMAGYGVIPASDVKVTKSSIAVKVDTSKVPNFVYTVGSGGLIAISWNVAAIAGKVPNVQLNKPQKATAQGNIANYALPITGVVSTIIYR